MENTITVRIKAEVFSIEKYKAYPCYLERALIEAGYKDVLVFAVGRTKIGGVRYVTSEPFGSSILDKAFTEGRDLIVTLKRQ